MSTTAELAAWVAAAKGLPPAVEHDARRCLLNFLGVCLAGSGEAVAVGLRELVAADGGAPLATVIGSGLRTDAASAAMLNAVAAHLPAYDDIHTPTGAHTSIVVLPAVLAQGEVLGASLGAVLTAFVVGVEVQLRVAHALGEAHYDRGWHNTATSGVFGAAAAAGRLLGLDGAAQGQAFGLAASMASGLREGFGAGSTTGLNTGRAAASGILAARLASIGFGGSAVTFDGPPGYLDTVGAAGDRAWLTRGLGETWLIRETTPKPYATGVFTHAAVDAGLALYKQGIDARRATKLELRVAPYIAGLCDKPDPLRGLSATMSLQHGLAVALLDGAAGPAQFTDARVRADDTRRLRQLAVVVPDAGVERDAAALLVVLDDGARHEVTIDHAVGSIANPVPDAVLAAKFAWTAGQRLNPERCSALARLIWSAPHAMPIGELVRLTAFAG